MLSKNYPLEYLSNLEILSINNFLIKESFNIIQGELDYFFDSKEYLVDVFIEGIDYSRLRPQALEERFCKVFYSQKELETFTLRIQKKINNEFLKSPINHNFNLNHSLENLFDIDDSFSSIKDASKTFIFSCSTVKAIDKVWKKSSRGLIPKEFNGLLGKLKVGEYFLSTVGLSPKEIKNSVNNKISKIILGIMKQNKIEIVNLLKQEVIAQVLLSESQKAALDIETDNVKTA